MTVPPPTAVFCRAAVHALGVGALLLSGGAVSAQLAFGPHDQTAGGGPGHRSTTPWRNAAFSACQPACDAPAVDGAPGPTAMVWLPRHGSAARPVLALLAASGSGAVVAQQDVTAEPSGSGGQVRAPAVAPAVRPVGPDKGGEAASLQFDAGYTTDSNVTRAKAGPDRLHDGSASASVSKRWTFDLTPQSRALLTGSAGGETFQRFTGLSRASLGMEAAYQYRASSDFDEPTYGAFASLGAEGFASSLRDGYRFGTGVSVHLPLTDRIGLFGAAGASLRNARSDVFSARERSLRAHLDYALSDRETLYLGSEWRRGDIVSTGRPSPDKASIARKSAPDDAFAGANMYSYRVEARTLLLTLGYNLGFGPRDSVDFSWRHVRSTPAVRPAFVLSPTSYRTNQLSAVYLLQF